MKFTSSMAGGDPLPVEPVSPGQQALEALSRIGDSDLREIVNLVQSICGVEAAAISILDGETYHLLVAAGLEPIATSSHGSLCEHTMDCHYTVVVDDAVTDERFSTSPYVDGRMHRLRFYASAPIYGPDHAMVGRLCLFDRRPRSLTSLQERTLSTLAASITKVIELRILQQEEDATEREQAVTTDDAVRVAAQISHDMRIPLTALTTSLEMLRESSPSEQDEHDEVREQLYATARRSADRISHMIEGLLQLNDAGRDLVLTDVDLTRLARQVAADVSPLLREAKAALRIGGLPVVRADADQLYSVLLNLLTNAVKFARPRVPPVIRIGSHRVDAGWRVSVVDNGRGVPVDRRDDVFSMFSRLNTAVEGHGIGLATVRRIVEMHGGKVGVGEGDDHGAEMWFELPDPVG
ncbi:MAG TPA: GAF domain-containing sensor histidine kinase [Marmoricola sp.]|nr:GAF domain-containing sensor histidine kinase [Marmoricola sp.]